MLCVCKPCGLVYVGYSSQKLKDRVVDHKSEFKRLVNMDKNDPKWHGGCEMAKHASKKHPDWVQSGKVVGWLKNIRCQVLWVQRTDLAMDPDGRVDSLKNAEAYWQGLLGSRHIGLNTRIEYNSAWRKNTAVDKHLR